MNKIKNKILKSNKKVLIIFLVLRVLLIQSIIIELISKNYSNSILCIITLLLFTLPVLLNNNNLEYPSIFEVLFYIFIISYELISIILPNQEIILQVLNSFICTGLIFKIINMLNKTNIINLSPLFICLITIAFSTTIFTIWELIEFSSDQITSSDVQKSQIVPEISSKIINKKDETKPLKIKGIAQTIIHHQDGTTIIENGFLDTGLIDTMHDLLIDVLVAILFNLFGFMYLKRQEN